MIIKKYLQIKVYNTNITFILCIVKNVIASLLLCISMICHGEDSTPALFPPTPPIIDGNSSSWLPSTTGIPISNLILPLSVLVFGFAIIAIIFAVYARSKDFSPDHAIRIVSISMLVIGVLFVVSTSYMIDISLKTELYAPAFGLLGTLAGYLLSRNHEKPNA